MTAASNDDVSVTETAENRNHTRCFKRRYIISNRNHYSTTTTAASNDDESVTETAENRNHYSTNTFAASKDDIS